MLLKRQYQDEDDFWRIRNFLREVFLLNQRLEYSWHVARLDYWRWHFIISLGLIPPLEQVTTLWETGDGKIAGVLHSIGGGEIRMHIHPNFRNKALEDDMITHALTNLAEVTGSGKHNIYLPIISSDKQSQVLAARHGLTQVPGWGHHWRRDLIESIPDCPLAHGYTIRSLGGQEEHSSRCLASWFAFHHDEPIENYDSDSSWYLNLQSTPLYRRDLDLVAVTEQDEVASFATIFYDDYTRSAVYVVVGTSSAHWRRGLGKAVLIGGMRRLQKLGCTRVFATAHDTAADALYGSVMNAMLNTDTWTKYW